jgi:hypothetical protein
MRFGQLNGEPSCIDLIQVDSKKQQEVYEIDSIKRAESEQLMDTWRPGRVLDVDQRTVGYVILRVSLCARD